VETVASSSEFTFPTFAVSAWKEPFERGPYVAGSIAAKGATPELTNEFAMAGVAALAIATPLAPFRPGAVAAGGAQIKHVLLISVDGMHPV
jgi:hypothetical protein